MREWFREVPAWVVPAASSLAVFVATLIAGYIVRWMVRHRLIAFAAATRSRWDDVVVSALARRIPTWSLLLGVCLAAGLWSLPPNIENALTKTLFAFWPRP
jgi:hypothetical protein